AIHIYLLEEIYYLFFAGTPPALSVWRFYVPRNQVRMPPVSHAPPGRPEWPPFLSRFAHPARAGNDCLRARDKRPARTVCPTAPRRGSRSSGAEGGGRSRA